MAQNHLPFDHHGSSLGILPPHRYRYLFVPTALSPIQWFLFRAHITVKIWILIGKYNCNESSFTFLVSYLLNWLISFVDTTLSRACTGGEPSPYCAWTLSTLRWFSTAPTYEGVLIVPVCYIILIVIKRGLWHVTRIWSAVMQTRRECQIRLCNACGNCQNFTKRLSCKSDLDFYARSLPGSWSKWERVIPARIEDRFVVVFPKIGTTDLHRLNRIVHDSHDTSSRSTTKRS